jgi:hypothetical protein
MKAGPSLSCPFGWRAWARGHHLDAREHDHAPMTPGREIKRLLAEPHLRSSVTAGNPRAGGGQHRLAADIARLLPDLDYAAGKRLRSGPDRPVRRTSACSVCA